MGWGWGCRDGTFAYFIVINFFVYCIAGDPHSNSASTTDTFKTLFVARIVSMQMMCVVWLVKGERVVGGLCSF